LLPASGTAGAAHRARLAHRPGGLHDRRVERVEPSRAERGARRPRLPRRAKAGRPFENPRAGADGWFGEQRQPPGVLVVLAVVEVVPADRHHIETLVPIGTQIVYRPAGSLGRPVRRSRTSPEPAAPPGAARPVTAGRTPRADPRTVGAPGTEAPAGGGGGRAASCAPTRDGRRRGGSPSPARRSGARTPVRR